MNSYRAALAVLFTIGISATSLAAPPFYVIRDITPSGYTSAVAYDINSDGDAVGVASRFVGGSPEEAYFIYDHSTTTSTVFGTSTLIPRQSIIGTGFRRAAINDDGFVAGSARFLGPVTETRGFIYNGTTILNLGTHFQGLGTGSNIRPDSDALDINSSGIATGTASSGRAPSDNVDAYKASSSPISDFDGDITALTGDDYGRAINDAGVVAGSNQDSFAALLDGASETNLVAGGPTSLTDQGSVATDLNDSGMATGHTISSGVSFIYDPSATTTLSVLPQIGTGNRMFAKAMNEDGDIVGWGDRDTGLSGQGRGFVYIDGTSYILEDQTTLTGFATPTLGTWEQLGFAWGINDNGWIVGQGDRRFTGGTFPTQRAYLLIPSNQIPEPSSSALVILAAGLLGTARVCSRCFR